MLHVNMLSGGLASWATGKLVAARHGTENLVHLFADTCYEDADTYRFLPEAVANIGGTFVRIADGRNPWQVFNDEKMLGNTRIDPCSKILKREILDRWLRQNCDPADTTIYVGMLWFERQRFLGGKVVNGVRQPGLQERMKQKGWHYESPLIDPPHLSKAEIRGWLEREGIDPPQLYDDGWHSNNCGGRCVKQGQAGWKMLLRKRPEDYLECERQENALREKLGDVSILRDRRGGTTKPLPLAVLRQRIEQGEGCDQLDFGKGCECMFGDSEDAPETVES